MAKDYSNHASTALVTIEGWTFAADEDEARVRDIDLAKELGKSRPRDIRPLIERMINEGEIVGVHERATVARSGFTERSVMEYWLTEDQALLVAARSETPAAAIVRRSLVRAFIALRRGAFAAPAIDYAALAKALAPMMGTDQVSIRASFSE